MTGAWLRWWDVTVIPNIQIAPGSFLNTLIHTFCALYFLPTQPVTSSQTYLIFFGFIRHCTSVAALAPLSDNPQPKPWQLSGHYTARRFSQYSRRDWLLTVSWLRRFAKSTCGCPLPVTVALLHNMKWYGSSRPDFFILKSRQLRRYKPKVG